jgi:hypothetical protein
MKTGITDVLEKRVSKTFSESSKDASDSNDKVNGSDIVEKILKQTHR